MKTVLRKHNKNDLTLTNVNLIFIYYYKFK